MLLIALLSILILLGQAPQHIDYFPLQTTIIKTLNQQEVFYEHDLQYRELTPSDLVYSAKQSVPRINTSTSSLKDIIPIFRGTVYPQHPLRWIDRCHQVNQATLAIHPETGYELNITATEPLTWYCADHYIYSTSITQMIDTIFKTGKHIIKQKQWRAPGEYEHVKQHGIQIFSFDTDSWSLLRSSLLLERLVKKIDSLKEKELINLTSQLLGITLFPRNEVLYHIDLHPHISSGDVLVVNRLSGESLLRWYVTSSPVAHVAIAVREETDDGCSELFVCESSAAPLRLKESEQTGFRKVPFAAWLDALHRDGYSVSWLPLQKTLSQNFDSQRAMDWFNKNIQPVHNETRLFAFLDNPQSDFPEEFPIETAIVAMALFDVSDDVPSDSLFDVRRRVVPGLSKRLSVLHNTTCSTFAECLSEMARVGANVKDVLSAVEKDSWTYPSENSTRTIVSPAGLVANMLREGGALRCKSSEMERNQKLETRSQKHEKKAELSEDDFLQLKTVAKQRLSQLKAKSANSTHLSNEESLSLDELIQNSVLSGLGETEKHKNHTSRTLPSSNLTSSPSSPSNSTFHNSRTPPHEQDEPSPIPLMLLVKWMEMMTPSTSHQPALPSSPPLSSSSSANVPPDSLRTPLFNANELTEGDITKLHIFDPNRVPPQCSRGMVTKATFCQLTGKYWMLIPNYNTIDPADGMFE
ncbi:hypothetical protein BLNAU_2593 [Blattamonas nauphoetae]|uniref:Uncharacterized protein n=1 Tax=Blattamonas nauphoetae TaxID=2049346 RepID=A0ABQ9YEZ8_9EUKA|nr:hypothetical protein BLNAU_2593 [Blattamonas nauphoetae]